MRTMTDRCVRPLPRQAACVAFGALIALACACNPRSSALAEPAGDAVAPHPALGPVPTGHVVAPVTAKWVVRSDQGGVLKIVARVELTSSLGIPLTVGLRIPTGLQLTAGSAATTIPAQAPIGVNETEYTFTYAATPTDDLVLVVDSQSSAFGVHAEDAYRFGRPAAAAPHPQATGPALQWKGANLGNSIRLDGPVAKPPPSGNLPAGTVPKP